MSGRKATTNIIPGRLVLSVGKPDKKIPVGWKWKLLLDIAELATGHTPSRKKPEYWGGDIPWMAVGDARKHNGKVIKTTKEYTNELGLANSAAVLLPKNTVCLSRTASIGYSILLGKPMATSQGFVNWICSEELNPRFLQLIFLAENRFLYEISEGTAHTTIYYPEVKAFHIAAPPISVQDLVVSKVDRLMGQVENMQKSLERIPQLLNDFRRQTLNSSFSLDIERVSLEDCCEKIQDGAHHSPKEVFAIRGKNMFPYVTAKNIRNNYMKLDTLVYVKQDYHNTIYPRCKPELGDVLLTKDGASTGNVTLNEFNEPISLLSSVCLIKTDRRKLLPAFLKFYIQSPIGFSEFTGKMTGTAIKRVVLKKIKRGTIPLPSIKVQTEVVNKVESLFLKADQIEKKYKLLKSKIDSLPQAILHKAFKGELVEQLTTDGDAKELLMEIEELKKVAK